MWELIALVCSARPCYDWWWIILVLKFVLANSFVCVAILFLYHAPEHLFALYILCAVINLDNFKVIADLQDSLSASQYVLPWSVVLLLCNSLAYFLECLPCILSVSLINASTNSWYKEHHCGLATAFMDKLTCLSGFFVVKFLPEVVLAVFIHLLVTNCAHLSFSFKC